MWPRTWHEQLRCGEITFARSDFTNRFFTFPTSSSHHSHECTHCCRVTGAQRAMEDWFYQMCISLDTGQINLKRGTSSAIFLVTQVLTNPLWSGYDCWFFCFLWLSSLSMKSHRKPWDTGRELLRVGRWRISGMYVPPLGTELVACAYWDVLWCHLSSERKSFVLRLSQNKSDHLCVYHVCSALSLSLLRKATGIQQWGYFNYNLLEAPGGQLENWQSCLCREMQGSMWDKKLRREWLHDKHCSRTGHAELDCWQECSFTSSVVCFLGSSQLKTCFWPFLFDLLTR